MNIQAKGRAITAAALTLALVACLAYIRHENELTRLYDEAAGYPTFDNLRAAKAAKKLGEYTGRRATDLLLKLARGNTRFVDTQARCEAIRALSTRKDAVVGSTLATLLAPHVPLAVRLEAAKTLRNLPCDAGCVGSILHYLERGWWGDKGFDERYILPPELVVLKGNDEAQERAALREYLYESLRGHKEETVPQLRDIYGLGTSAPAVFGVTLSAEVDIPESCGLLLHSAQDLSQIPPERLAGPRAELSQSLKILKCR
jgi:hypothetical protein